MALDYTIDPEARIITITGEYAEAVEWRDLLGRILHDPRRQPGFAFVRDLREATRPVDVAAVIAIIDVVQQFWPRLQPSKAAIVTARDVDAAALVAHALADSKEIPLQAFNSYDSALEWLRKP